MAILTGITIDSPRTRLCEQAAMIQSRPEGGYLLELSVVNAADQIDRDGELEARYATKARYSGGLRSDFYLPERSEALGFNTVTSVPAMTVRLYLDENCQVESYDVIHSRLKALACLDYPQFDKYVNDGEPAFAIWRKVFGQLALVLDEDKLDTSSPGALVAKAVSVFTNRYAAKYLHDNGKAAAYGLSYAVDGGAMQTVSRLTHWPDTADVQAFAPITAGLRNYHSLVNQRILAAALDDDVPPYAESVLAEYTDSFNEKSFRRRRAVMATQKVRAGRLPESRAGRVDMLAEGLHDTGRFHHTFTLATTQPSLLMDDKVLEAVFNPAARGSLIHRHMCDELLHFARRNHGVAKFLAKKLAVQEGEGKLPPGTNPMDYLRDKLMTIPFAAAAQAEIAPLRMVEPAPVVFLPVPPVTAAQPAHMVLSAA